jgi:hypothetical protein
VELCLECGKRSTKLTTAVNKINRFSPRQRCFSYHATEYSMLLFYLRKKGAKKRWTGVSALNPESKADTALEKLNTPNEQPKLPFHRVHRIRRAETIAGSRDALDKLQRIRRLARKTSPQFCISFLVGALDYHRRARSDCRPVASSEFSRRFRPIRLAREKVFQVRSGYPIFGSCLRVSTLP